MVMWLPDHNGRKRYVTQFWGEKSAGSRQLSTPGFTSPAVQFSWVTQSCPTLCNTMDCSMPSFPVHQQLPELEQTHVHWVADTIQPSHPLSAPSPPVFNLFQHQGLFQWVGSSHQVAEILNFSFTISLFNEYSELISFQIDWFDLAIQGTLKSLLQHHCSKVSILWDRQK